MNAIARFISYVTHPLIMPMLGLVLLFELETIPITFYKVDALFYFPREVKTTFYQIFGILLFAAPMLSIVIMRINKIIPSLEMQERKHRNYPLGIVTFYFAMSFYWLRFRLEDPFDHPALLGYFFGMIVIFVTCIIINALWLKISLHAVGIFALLGALIGYNQTQMAGFESSTTVPNLIPILIVVGIAGLIGFARMQLKAHTLREFIMGSVVGFSIMFFTVKFGVFV